MTKFVLKRLAKGLLTVWFIWTLVFVLVRLSGDPIEWMIPDVALESVKEELKARLGLDRPIWEQYILSFQNLKIKRKEICIPTFIHYQCLGI